MKKLAFGAVALAFAIPVAAQTQTNSAMQPSGAMMPQTRTVVRPVAPPVIAVTPVAPGVVAVTPVPGVKAATPIKVQKFSDYDLDRDGRYNPMEFAQAVHFLATSDPVAGNPALPDKDRFDVNGAPQKMRPVNAAALLLATSDELARVDTNGDRQVSPEEMRMAAMM